MTYFSSILSSFPFHLMFIVTWTEITYIRVFSLSIVTCFNVVKYSIFCLFPCSIRIPTQPFFFQCSPKAFDERVIMAITLSTYIDLNIMFFQHLLMAFARIFASSIRMMYQPNSRLPLDQCHLQCSFDQLCVMILAHRPTNSFA